MEVVKVSLKYAYSVILATARANVAIIWTQDIDFNGIEDVRYIIKKK